MKTLKIIIVLIFTNNIIYSQTCNDSIIRNLKDKILISKEKKDYQLGICLYDTLIILEPYNYNNYYFKGIGLSLISQYDSSVFYLNKALQLGKDSISVFESLFLIYDIVQDKDSALFYINQLILLNPKNAQYFIKRSFLQKDKQLYLEDLKRAADLGNKQAKRFYDEDSKRFNQ